MLTICFVIMASERYSFSLTTFRYFLYISYGLIYDINVFAAFLFMLFKSLHKFVKLVKNRCLPTLTSKVFFQ